mmetsp:Transcript_15469/g.22714  ORF Transcript_15469/g.22714 Transcript_15469/m.22714 type:complete len:96 (-) Transcript_15469:257-544(-)
MPYISLSKAAGARHSNTSTLQEMDETPTSYSMSIYRAISKIKKYDEGGRHPVVPFSFVGSNDHSYAVSNNSDFSEAAGRLCDASPPQISRAAKYY